VFLEDLTVLVDLDHQRLDLADLARLALHFLELLVDPAFLVDLEYHFLQIRSLEVPEVLDRPFPIASLHQIRPCMQNRSYQVLNEHIPWVQTEEHQRMEPFEIHFVVI
jgi:hypothetical protein